MSAHFAAMNANHRSEDGMSPPSSYHTNSNSSQQQHYEQPNPQSGSSNNPSQPSSPRKKGGGGGGGRKDLPPLFWYMEMGDWEKATSRAKSHPKEVKSRATLRTKSMAEDNNATQGGGTKVSGTKRLALHHACFKLRSAGSAPIPETRSSSGSLQKEEDPFLAVCKFILLLLEIYPDACQVRESRHGCLPLHLAAFASCYVRPPSTEEEEEGGSGSGGGSGGGRLPPLPNITNSHSSDNNSNPTTTRGGTSGTTNNGTQLERPKIMSVRSCSESTTSTVHSNMTAILMEESFAAAQTLRKKEGVDPPALAPLPSGHASQQQQQQRQQPTNNNKSQQNGTAAAAAAATDNNNNNNNNNKRKQTIFISNKREQMAVRVLNAMLDAYPRAIRLDSEGGRLPLHTACAGRATPRCVSLLLRAYPAAARHRNKDGFLPLHLAAHWGVSHPNVAITLLKAYPDATVGRNRWERTPLEEALVMAGENGRPHQAPLVRALRKHPSYWTRPPKELFQASGTSDHPNGMMGSNVVDIDITLASNDDETSLDDNPRYFNSGHSLLLEDEYEQVPEGEEACLEYNEQGGIISRLRRRRSSRNVTVEEHMTQDLPTLIKNLKWKSVIARLECNPDEAYDELVGVMTRGGFAAGSGMTPLHYACERKPPVEVVEALIEANAEAVTQRMMPGGCLPLHIACTWQSSPAVVGSLLRADPMTAKVVDELGNRPLHSACFSGAPFQVVHDLLSTYSKAVLSRNNQGSQPIDISRRLRHANRRSVMTALLEKKEQIIAKQKHRRGRSSGSMADYAKKAANLNDQFSGSLTSSLSSFAGGGGEDSPAAVGVEVSYDDHDKSQTLLWI